MENVQIRKKTHNLIVITETRLLNELGLNYKFIISKSNDSYIQTLNLIFRHIRICSNARTQRQKTIIARFVGTFSKRADFFESFFSFFDLFNMSRGFSGESLMAMFR